MSTTTRPVVLVTNDDGINAAGLVSAARAVVTVGKNALVVAPDRDWSGNSMALGAFAGVRVQTERVDWSGHGLAHMPVYQASASPAALVTLAAHSAFGPRPDMVLAGMNHGANTGIGVVHSATVGAALTAGLAGIPALAVSVRGRAAEIQWARCEQVVAAVVAALGQEPAPPGGALNVNLPAEPPSDPSGVAWRSLATIGTTTGRLERHTEPTGSTTVRMLFDPTTQVSPAVSDSGALLRGEVTLTWLALPHGEQPGMGWRRRLLDGIRDRWPRGGLGTASWIPDVSAGRQPLP